MHNRAYATWPLLKLTYYVLVRRLMAAILHIFGHWELDGVERMPRDGPLIVVANHLNEADPPVLAASLPRPIHFMAKQELFAQPLGGPFVSLFGAFPVRRFEADLRALRTAQRLLEAGGVIGMFPEGHRSDEACMIRAQPGTALLALRSGAPVLPVAITGTEVIHSLTVLTRRPRITVTVGEPFTLPAGGRITAERVEAASDEIMRRVAALLPEAYRGLYS